MIGNFIQLFKLIDSSSLIEHIMHSTQISCCYYLYSAASARMQFPLTSGPKAARCKCGTDPQKQYAVHEAQTRTVSISESKFKSKITMPQQVFDCF